ncbi:Cytoskeleton protein RodZ [Paraliobacillus sp. PM-2]|uniref:helix-turn-helix domain-containing protein n=1 Tax=Paraliobacillus sp. PM-2 TaxID=1462524 RepID=UPI00061C9ABB|nr:helix-turn-helix domain-containing protein [Paraliobacillus sp. PM-2]CQR47629.1 Cytoskeleton protein RodZ [Paraliobacillus sp. PM-2]
MEIGMRLKEAREAKNLSIEDIEKMTKIQSRYLKAIEKGEFSLLPGTFYTRAFIKEYAIALGLNASELLEEYSHELPSMEEDPTIEYTRVQRSKKTSNLSQKRSPIFSLLPTIITGILIVGVAFIIYLISSDFFSNDDKENTEPPSSEQNGGDEVTLPPESEDDRNEDDTNSTDKDDNNEAPTEEKSENEADQEPTLELVEFENDQSTYEFTYKKDQITLEFETEGRNWLEVEDSNGENLYYGNFQQNDSPMQLDISDNEQIFLKFGEPTTISIELNGVPLKLPDDISSPTAVQRVWINMNQDIE